MTASGIAIPDTDWFVRDLYSFVVDIGASVIAANYSRFVVDLNRPADDSALYAGKVSTGLCPLRTFAGDDIYLPGESVSSAEIEQRTQTYWQPYHAAIRVTLGRIKDKFGFAALWDAHSIAAEVPRLFPGVLPDLNIGTNSGASCDAACEAAVMAAARASDYSSVANDRFRGGYITRNYGKPEQNYHAVQLELSQRCYLRKNDLRYDDEYASSIRETIKEMLSAFVTAAGKSR